MEQNATFLETVWGEYREQLLAFIRTKISSPEDAEDILTDVFVKLARQEALSRTPHSLPSWLYRVTRNSIIDFYRMRRPLENLPEDLIQEQPDPQILTTLSACISPMIHMLPDVYKSPMLLSEIEGKKQKQVAIELGLSLPAVKSRILRGRKKLKALMVSCCTLYQNKSGQIIDYKQISSEFCDKCEN